MHFRRTCDGENFEVRKTTIMDNGNFVKVGGKSPVIRLSPFMMACEEKDAIDAALRKVSCH